MTKTTKKTKEQTQTQPADFSQAPMLPPESALGQPEEFMTDDTVLGVGMHLRCPHCQGELEIFDGHQHGYHQPRLQCDNGHLLCVSVMNVPGRAVLCLATTRNPETYIR
jgi:hypothetical protein